MNIASPVRPAVLCFPIEVTRDNQQGGVGGDDDEADPKMAMVGEPIVGLERVVYDESTGPGALAARPLPSPKSMSAAAKTIHDLTHLPYDPGCEICVYTRRPNTHHRSVKSDRTIPLLVGDYCFPKHSGDMESITTLVIRVYPYKLFFVCVVPVKGRDPRIVQRLERFIKECGLVHFTFRSDREPSIVAMLEEACALAGRRGTHESGTPTEPTVPAPTVSHDDLVNVDGTLDLEPRCDDEPNTPKSADMPSSHTAAPEMTHPGESQSNGLAERSVGMWEDQFRTLKHALEVRLKHRVPLSHPVITWLVEHTAWVLNKFHLDGDGRTAYGRLHGREGHERVCEFGERIMWFVPKKMRAKMDQRWRYGIFLGRSLSSDQNYVGLSSGDVICARAIVRVVPEMRWSHEAISKISTTPITFRAGALDKIEESAEPHAHLEPSDDVTDATRQIRRLKLFDADVKKFGMTESCQRCEFLRQNKPLLARGVRHNEECRERIYDALRATGSERVQRADLEDSSRTVTRTRKPRDPPIEATVDEKPVDEPMVDDAPTEPLPDIGDTTPHVEPNKNEYQVDDTFNFHEEVDEELGDQLEVDWDGDQLHDGDGDHIMATLMNVLQTNGVSVGDAAEYAVHIMKNSKVSPVALGESYNPTMFEVYGHGTIVDASHGIRRSLNVNGLRALDLRTTKPNGAPWDFSIASDRQLARSMIEEEKPTWVIGSPPCTFFSAWNQGINLRKMAPERVERLRKEAVKHLHFIAGLYKLQLSEGRHFLHEHPATATSWSDPWIEKLMKHPRVSSVISDQCEYGLLTPDANGVPIPAKKPTRWMSSSPAMIQRLSRRCSGDHVHQHLVGGRAKAAEDYSIELVTEILRGIRDTADAEEKWGDECSEELSSKMKVVGSMHDAHNVSVAAAYRAEDMNASTERLTVKVKYADGRVGSTDLVFKDSYKDEYTNEQLPMGHVKKAMHDELLYFCDSVWVLVPVGEVTGKTIGSRWVNCNKNDLEDPDVRCRLVGQEVNLHADESFYAATPPLEAKRMLFSEFSCQRTRDGKPLQISFVDVKKAYFYGIPEREIYVRLPPELGVSKQYVGKLVRCMYGTRDAGAIWESCYASCLIKLGFVQGKASPCCFNHPIWNVNVVVHGDDFTALGNSDGLDKFEKGMTATFECKLKGRLGTGDNDMKEMRVLNRIVRITPDGLLYEADPRHAEMLIKAFKLEDSKPVVTPGVKPSDPEPDPDKLDHEVAEEIHAIISSLSPSKCRRSRVSFCSHVEYHDVVPYKEIYGKHPRTFNFNKHGAMMRVCDGSTTHQYDGHKVAVSPNARRTILENVLRDGAAWETPTVELIAKVSKRKFAKARLGSKAAKHAERLEQCGDELDDEAATLYRALSARILYLSMDRPEIAYAAKELCRHFAHPTRAGVEALKRTARFLVGLPRVVWNFPFQRMTDAMNVYVDTDFGGCQTTRRSTSGGIAMRGRHPLKHWSLTQTTIALSSGEAELSGICRGASIALGLQSLAQDLGISLKIHLFTDATAAIGICRRRGLGKIRHLHVSDLWVQDRLKRGDFSLSKIAGSENPADILTKHVSRELLVKHMAAMNLSRESGRASSAPSLVT